MTKQTQKGFTLVELAIVMTIIGLLIGGILKGQELMMNAKVTATVAQVKGIEAAITSFRDAYNLVPGDIGNAAGTLLASRLIPGCTTTCNNTYTGLATGSLGDGIVGLNTWTGAAAWAQQGTQVAVAGGTSAAAETGLFWLHLLQANLIGGITNQSMTANQTYAWSVTQPAGRIGGGFVAGFGTGTNMPGDASAGTHGPTGLIIALLQAPNSVPTSNTTANLITPARAAQIDRKMDDGNGVSGSVQAYGVTANCMPTAATNSIYREDVTSNDCGLVFRVQN